MPLVALDSVVCVLDWFVFGLGVLVVVVYLMGWSGLCNIAFRSL